MDILCSSSSNQITNSSLTANDLSEYFHHKIERIRTEISLFNPPTTYSDPVHPSPQILSTLPLTSANEVKKIINSSKKTNTPNEDFPSKYYPNTLPVLLPHLIALFNLSFSTGDVPDAFKQAIIRPILKKPKLDPNVPCNYRPISLLPFLSKILERLLHK